MRIVLLNQPFYPDVVSTAQMAKDLADHLVSRGHEVHAVASRSVYGQAGASFPRREIIGGIRIHRVGVNLFSKRGLATRALDFCLFYLLAVARILTLPRPDVVVCLTTPPMIALTGLVCRALRGSRAVYWIMDLYPDVPIASGALRPGSITARVFGFLGNILLRRSDATVVLGRCMRQRILDKGAPPDRVRFIPVWPIDAGIRPVPRDANALRVEWGLAPGDTVVMYSGNFGIAHEAATICRAMLALRDRPDIRFEFVGSGTRRPEVEAFIRDHALANAHYRDYVPRGRLAESLSAADIHLVSIREGFEGLIVPSKLYGAMAAGRPTVFIGSDRSEIALMIRESDCGALVREGDDRTLARTILELAADRDRCVRLGQNARSALAGKYDRHTACDAWAILLESLVAGPAPAAQREDAA